MVSVVAPATHPARPLLSLPGIPGRCWRVTQKNVKRPVWQRGLRHPLPADCSTCQVHLAFAAVSGLRGKEGVDRGGGWRGAVTLLSLRFHLTGMPAAWIPLSDQRGQVCLSNHMTAALNTDQRPHQQHVWRPAEGETSHGVERQTWEIKPKIKKRSHGNASLLYTWLIVRTQTWKI